MDSAFKEQDHDISGLDDSALKSPRQMLDSSPVSPWLQIVRALLVIGSCCYLLGLALAQFGPFKIRFFLQAYEGQFDWSKQSTWIGPATYLSYLAGLLIWLAGGLALYVKPRSATGVLWTLFVWTRAQQLLSLASFGPPQWTPEWLLYAISDFPPTVFVLWTFYRKPRRLAPWIVLVGGYLIIHASTSGLYESVFLLPVALSNLSVQIVGPTSHLLVSPIIYTAHIVCGIMLLRRPPAVSKIAGVVLGCTILETGLVALEWIIVGQSLTAVGYMLAYGGVPSAIYFLLFARGRQRAMFRDQNRCIRCGYSLRDLPELRCPECGTAFDAKLLEPQ